jgi:hypothetical protein
MLAKVADASASPPTVRTHGSLQNTPVAKVNADMSALADGDLVLVTIEKGLLIVTGKLVAA